MAVDHYENFPVASLLLPPALRPAVKAIYAFARSADDIADEGDEEAATRLSQLQAYVHELDRIEAGEPSQLALFDILRPHIAHHALPLQAFRDLLSAFQQDVVKQRYENFDELMDYCHHSADPVGRLMLHLYGEVNATNIDMSNAICSALQLINFWQDVAIDWRKPRVYIPQEDLRRFGVDETSIAHARCDAPWRALMRFQTERARQLMLRGAPLCKALPGRIGWELRLVVQGGLRILECIDRVDGDIFHRRPALAMQDWPHLLWRAVSM